MVVDTVCVVQALMVPQILRAPGTLTFPAEVGLVCGLRLGAENLSGDFLFRFECHPWFAVACYASLVEQSAIWKVSLDDVACYLECYLEQ